MSWAYALSRLSGSTAASFLYLVPLVAVGIAWFWLGEVPSLLALWGGLLVLAGVVLVNTHRQRHTLNEEESSHGSNVEQKQAP